MNKTIYVSQKGRDYWSGAYPEPLKDLSDGPIASLSYANCLISNYVAQGEICDYTVKIADGIYRATAPLTLSTTVPVTYEPYENETVLLNGAKIIGGWCDTEVNGAKAIKAFVPEAINGALDIKSLFINGIPAVKTVYPADAAKLRMSGLPEGRLTDGLKDGNRAFRVKKGDLDFISDIENCEIIALHYWVDEHLPVKYYDREKGVIYSECYSRFILRDDKVDDYSLYRVENVFEELKTPGQWYFDKKNCYIYYIPRENETKDNITAEIPVTASLLNIAGKEKEKAGNLTFKNIIFENTLCSLSGSCSADRYGKSVRVGSSIQGAFELGGAVTLEFADNCRFENCTFRNIGDYAIDIKNGCKYNTVTDCEIYNGGAGGIKIGGGDSFADRSLTTGCNLIENNHIHHNNRICKSAIGIFTLHSFSNRIRKNSIHDMEYSGISCGWVWGYGESVSHSNIIEYNHIYNLGSGDMSDMGGIYVLGSQPGTEIRGNHIHNIIKANYGGWGIYLDEGSSHILVEKNIVHHTASSPFNIHYGKENTVRHNIFAFGEIACVGFVRGEYHIMATFTGNIFVTDKKAVFEGGYSFRFSEAQVISDNNFIFDTSENAPRNLYRYQEGAGDEIATWEYWTNSGHDTHSLYCDPGFQDLDNFVLREDSVAYKNGFPRDVKTEYSAK